MPIDYLKTRPMAVADTECYPNLWAIGFRDIATKRVLKVKMQPGEELDRDRIAKCLRYYRWFSFNGKKYDLPMIMYAMSGATCEELKELNDRIIPPKGSGMKGMMPWEVFEEYGLEVPDWMDHIDLIDVAPAAAQRVSLKKYAGMQHSRKMQELPYAINTVLDDFQVEQVMAYLDNDLEVTEDLALELMPLIEIRNKTSAQIGVDVRSMSNAQIGEAILRKKVEKRKGGKRLYKPDIVTGAFKYEPPAYISFQTETMQQVLSRLKLADFVVRADGYVQLPEMFGAKKKKDTEQVDDEEELEGGAEIRIGEAVYKMGIGGLHSQEERVYYEEDDEYVLEDNDVTGYYPNLMIESGREPDNMRGHFIPVFKGIKLQREIDKKAGRVDEAETGKIATNGLFGKTGSPYSIVYAPRMMIQTTVTGQLSILMLIEECEMNGWQVISANTDGFVTKVPRAEYGAFRAVIFDWENRTGLRTERTQYRGVYSLSVNSYFAFKKKEKKGVFTGEIEVKRKGKFAHSGRGLPASFGLKKTPDLEISYDAAVEFMLKGTPIEETIRDCQDVRKFVNVRAVKGGAVKGDEYIAKVIRVYFADGETEGLHYLDSGNKVPKTIGAVPLMELPDELPGDIDYAYYERQAYGILDKCGVDVPDPTTFGRAGYFFGRLDDQKTVHRVDARSMVALCGMKRKDRTDLWVEFDKQPDDQRFCGKCRKAHEL